MKSPSLSVVMFAYNEGENIGSLVRETLAELEVMIADSELSDYQMVLVNDGSTDNTGEVIDQLALESSKVTPLCHGTNRGIGAAVKTGFAATRMEYVCILPADGQVTLSEIRKLLPSVGAGADMALGYYTQRLGVDGLGRMILSRGLRVLLWAALGTRRRIDGVYVLRRALLKQIPLKSESFFVNLELPVRVMREGFDVRSVPVEVKARRAGESKVLGLGRMGRVARELMRFRVNLILEGKVRFRPPW